MRPTTFFTTLLVPFFFAATASAQVFDSGPSDSTLFTNVINLPGGVLPDVDNETIAIGGVDDETIQVNFAAGSSVTDSLDILEGAEVNISGGTVAEFSAAANGTEVNISDGSLGDLFFAAADVEINISGGTVGNQFVANGSMVNISGGTVGNRFSARDGSVINVSGGSIDVAFSARDGSTVNLFGSNFALDGVSLDNLVPGEAFTINTRDVSLTGILADGTDFSFDLNSEFQSTQDSFLNGSTLTVTLSSDILPGDVSQDGVVNFLDISFFVSILAANGDQAEADINEDGVVSFLDIAPFIALLSL